MPRLDRKAHHLLEDRHREIDARLRRRLREVTDALDLAPGVRPEFLRTCACAAHLHAAECARVDHEFRSGRGSTGEEEVLREAVAERHWEESLVLLHAAITTERQRRQLTSESTDTRTRVRVRYQPMERVTRSFTDWGG